MVNIHLQSTGCLSIESLHMVQVPVVSKEPISDFYRIIKLLKLNSLMKGFRWWWCGSDTILEDEELTLSSERKVKTYSLLLMIWFNVLLQTMYYLYSNMVYFVWCHHSNIRNWYNVNSNRVWVLSQTSCNPMIFKVVSCIFQVEVTTLGNLNISSIHIFLLHQIFHALKIK